ncbi:MAG: hypothetical protein M0Q51_06380 [Bacteroidales bacterium]|nr:hypothetical protein [Bacteroidales bacterium]
MALPTATDLKKMDYGFLGEPLVWIASKDSMNLMTMDYGFLGEPFVSNPFGGVIHNIDKANTVSWWTRIKRFGGKLIADIEKINQTEP